MRSRFPLASALLLALAGGACATLPSGPPLPDAEVRALADRLAPGPLPSSWQVSLEGIAAGGGRQTAFSAYLLLAPGRARLEVPGEMGSTLFLAVDDGERAWTAGEAEGSALPLPRRLSPLFDLWNGCLPRGEAGPIEARLLPSGEREVASPLSGGRVRYWWSGESLRSVRWEDEAGSVTLEFLLGHPWRLTAAGGRVTATARVTEAVAGERVPAGAFTPPPGARPGAGTAAAP